MKGDSPKGKAWANAVRATLCDSPKPTQLKWKFSFLDHIQRTKTGAYIKGDFSLPFGAFDNSDLKAYISLDLISDSSTFDTFHIQSSSIKAIKQAARQLDEALHDNCLELNLPNMGNKTTSLHQIKSMSQILRFECIKNPIKKIQCAKKVLNNPNTVPATAYHVWEEIAGVYFSDAKAIHLAEPIFRAVYLYSQELELKRSGIYSAHHVGYCLFLRNKWNEAIEYLEEAIKHGFKSSGISEIIDMSQTKLNEINS